MGKNTEFCIQGKNMKAVGHFEGDAFVVHKGAKCNNKTEASKKYSPNYYKNRTNLETSGVIKDGVFVEDYKFKSIAAATGVITCSTRPYRSVWKTYDSYGTLISYDDYIKMQNTLDINLADKASEEERERGIPVTRYTSNGRAIEWRGVRVKKTA